MLASALPLPQWSLVEALWRPGTFAGDGALGLRWQTVAAGTGRRAISSSPNSMQTGGHPPTSWTRRTSRWRSWDVIVFPRTSMNCLTNRNRFIPPKSTEQRATRPASETAHPSIRNCTLTFSVLRASSAEPLDIRLGVYFDSVFAVPVSWRTLVFRFRYVIHSWASLLVIILHYTN